ncbi:MAG: acyltransferase [Odoribacteraceae bacterium]|jgi:hypothetical protein|nr:acyltransferase [Odoribacteraceae bacterium]
MNDSFDDLRPYRDDEIPAAMQRITADELFPRLAAFVYPGLDLERVRAMVRGYVSVEEFQLQTMKTFVEQVIARSTTGFSVSGLQDLDPARRYLFVSNHRDIVLDASFLQYALYRAGHRTSEVSFGSNLMSSPLVVDVGKANKMFKLVLGGTARELYATSSRLSAYIRHAITVKRESVWIAQRNGRTKDGRDVTDRGIIKMFRLSAPGNPVDALAALNIVPLSISYEWEPCDVLKALERYRSRQGRYVKQPGEDLRAIITGVTAPKGEVHLRVGAPLSADDLLPFVALSPGGFNERVAALVDSQVTANYRLSCNNYIASDLLAGNERHARHYSPVQRDLFHHHYRVACSLVDVEDPAAFSSIFLGIYANPVAAREESGG